MRMDAHFAVASGRWQLAKIGVRRCRRSVLSTWGRMLLASSVLFIGAALAQAQGIMPATAPLQAGDNHAPAAAIDISSLTNSLPLSDLSKKENLASALQIIVVMTVLSLAPAILIMMTSFTRIIIVLSLLRHALGTASLPPNQVLIGLSLFMTVLIMGPTWQRVNNDAIGPYMDGTQPDQKVMWQKAQQPVRDFMINQIEKSGNRADVYLFTDFAREKPRTYADVGTMTLVPAFMLSELKTAFLMGFKIYLPFLIIDMVISAVLISMGMMMLPPVLISLPFKLLLFVLVDGWRLITQGLLGSFMTG